MLSRGFSSAVPDTISDVQWLDDDMLLIQERDDERPTVITDHYRADSPHGPAGAVPSANPEQVDVFTQP